MCELFDFSIFQKRKDQVCKYFVIFVLSFIVVVVVIIIGVCVVVVYRCCCY